MFSSKKPHFSIVIPTFNRPRGLAALISSLAVLEYELDKFETIVVDDGGDASLEPIIRALPNDLRVTLLRQDNTGPSGARNFGAARAKGEFLAFIDDDCLPDPSWLRTLADRFEADPCCIYGGKAVNALRGNYCSTATQLLVDYLYENYKPGENLGGFFPANNLAVPREIFLDIGGFDRTMRFGEDRDLCYRLASQGYRFAFAPEALVYHFHVLNLFTLLQLHFSYGGGSFQFWKRRSQKRLGAVKLSPLSWYLELILSGVREEKSALGLLYTLLLVVIQGACTAGLFWELAKDSPSFRS